jgi:hydroxypyruvate reductase
MNNTDTIIARQNLLQIYQQALQAVAGDRAVAKQLQNNKLTGLWYLIAIGKAAAAMTQGALTELQLVVRGLVISKHQHIDAALYDDTRLDCIESDHPVPGEASFEAGETLINFINQLPDDAQCLFLISGGTSSLVEVLAPNCTKSDMQELTQYLLANAYSIQEINAKRQKLSRIKGGKLWQFLQQRKVHALLISDVPNDDPAIIGSGLLFPSPAFFTWQICASSTLACQAAAQAAEALGYSVFMQKILECDAVEAGNLIAETLKQAAPGIYIWGAETTVQLPTNSGKGGRNQHLALAAAIAIENQPLVYILAAATDGTDGFTDDAGGLVDGQTLARGRLKGFDPAQELAKANSNTFLAASGDLLHTGVTGTNVMDLVIALKL